MDPEADLHLIVKRVVARMLGSEKVSGNSTGQGPEPTSTTAPAPAAARSKDPVAIGAESTPAASGPVAIGADHGGFALKESLKQHLEGRGLTVIDVGTHSTEAVDYPDYARAVAVLVSAGTACRGVMIDGAGIGSCMAANKVRGVRASMCYDNATANNAREHNDANVLTLGAGMIEPGLARQILDTWLDTPFAGGRHAKRVDKIMALEGK